MTVNERPVIDEHTQDLARQMRQMTCAETETDTIERARWRVNVTAAAFYDDEPSEPDQALRDLFADLCHEAAARGVDIDSIIRRGRWMYEQERDEWGERG